MNKFDMFSMKEMRDAWCLTRFLLKFCRSQYAEVLGWQYWVEYKVLFGRKYFFRAYIN